MMIMNWNKDKAGRLGATWSKCTRGCGAPSYLTMETADHTAGSVNTTIRARSRARAGRVWHWLMERAGEFAAGLRLPPQVAKSKVTGLVRH